SRAPGPESGGAARTDGTLNTMSNSAQECKPSPPRKRDLERSEARPLALPVRPEGIPAELKARDQWVCWRYTWVEAKDKWGKPPLNARTGRRASSTDSKTWSPFEVALAAYRDARNEYDGIGYVFSEDDPFCGVDLDDALGAGGRLKEWADELVAALGSYTEWSPSGTGVKLVLRGRLASRGRRRPCEDGEVEVYDRGRYFALTGHALDWTPAEVLDQQPALEGVHRKVFGPAKGEAPPPSDPASRNGYARHQL